MDYHQDQSENPYAAPPIEADLAMANSPFGVDLDQEEQIRYEFLSHESSVRSVGILYYILAGIFGLIAFSYIMSLLAAYDWRFSNRFVSSTPHDVGVCILFLIFNVFLTVLLFLIGVGLRRVLPWSRIVSGILSGLGLLHFPIGTIINGYILYLLFSRKGRMVFSLEYREIIARTPHIKYKTSLLVKILAVVLLAIFGIGILGVIFCG